MMVESKDFFLSPNDIDNVTDVIEHLSNVIKYGVRNDINHNLWASYFLLAKRSFARMSFAIERSCKIEEASDV